MALDVYQILIIFSPSETYIILREVISFSQLTVAYLFHLNSILNQSDIFGNYRKRLCKILEDFFKQPQHQSESYREKIGNLNILKLFQTTPVDCECFYVSHSGGRFMVGSLKWNSPLTPLTDQIKVKEVNEFVKVDIALV